MKFVICEPDGNPWFLCLNKDGVIKAMFRHVDEAEKYAVEKGYTFVKARLEQDNG